MVGLTQACEMSNTATKTKRNNACAVPGDTLQMGGGKKGASLGQRQTCLVNINAAAKGLTTKAIYLIRKQVFYSAPFIELLSIRGVLPRATSP